MAQWIPLIVTTLTVCFGFITYSFQRRLDRKEDLIKTRRAEYRKWLQAFYDVLNIEKQNTLLEFNKSTNDLFLFGSDQVIKAVGSFTRYMAITSGENTPRDMTIAGNLLALVVQKMRNDCFETTRLSEDEVRNILPIQGTADYDFVQP